MVGLLGPRMCHIIHKKKKKKMEIFVKPIHFLIIILGEGGPLSDYIF